MNLIVVTGAVVFVVVFAALLIGVLRRPGSGNHLTVADIQARLAREEDVEVIADRAATQRPAAFPAFRDSPFRDPAVRDAALRKAAYRGTPMRDTSVQGVRARNAASRSVPSREIPVQTAFSQGIAETHGAPAQGAPPRNPALLDASSHDPRFRGAAPRIATARDASFRDLADPRGGSGGRRAFG